MMKNENKTNQDFQNFHALAAKAISDIEAFVAMDINEQWPPNGINLPTPPTPQKAILVGVKAQLVSLKDDIKATQERANKAKQDAENFRDMMPTSQEFYADAKAEFGDI